MAAHFVPDFDLSQWRTWIVPVAGLTSTGLALLMGGALLRWRKRQLPLEAPSAPATQLATFATQVADPSKTERDPFEHGSTKENRSSIRRRGKFVRVFISNEAALAEPTEGWVIDRSLGGLCLSVKREIPLDTILSVKAANAGEQIPWVQVHIKRCQSTGERWELGCEFVRVPSWNVLMLFG